MEIGGVFATSWTMLRQRFWRLVGMWAVFALIQIVGVIVLSVVVIILGFAGLAGMGALLDSPGAGLGAGLGAGMIAVMAMTYAAYIMLVLAQQAALVTLASPQADGAFAPALRRGFASAPAFFAITLLLLIAYVAVNAAAEGVAALAGEPLVSDMIAALVMLPLTVYLGCRLAVLVPVVAVDGRRNPLAAVRRCWTLTRGRAGAVFAALVGFAGVTLAIFIVPFAAIIMLLASDTAAAAQPAWVALAPLLFFPVLVVYMIYAAAFAAALHHHLTDGGAEAMEAVFA